MIKFFFYNPPLIIKCKIQPASVSSEWTASRFLLKQWALETSYRINWRFWHGCRHVTARALVSTKSRKSSKAEKTVGPLTAEQEGEDLWINSLCRKDWNSLVKTNRARAAELLEAPPQQFLSWGKSMATAIKTLSLFLFLQVWSFSLLLLWSLHSILNTGRGQSESYFIVLCVTIRLSSFPALEYCWSADWSRVLKRSEKHDSLQSICQRKLSLPLWYHKAPQSSSPSELPHVRENCFLFTTSYFCGQYFFRRKCHLQKSLCERQM